uniref:Metalloprotease TIKI homolog n=1 Tax=Meloidogyne hapla TaxID=6305 RepID=A0A1I8BB88_MELHA
MTLKIFLFYYLTFCLQAYIISNPLSQSCRNLINSTGETYFWSIRPPNESENKSNESNQSKSYLFGSLHVSWNLIWDFVPSLVKAVMLNKTEIAVFEHDLLNHTNLKNIFNCLDNTESDRQAQNLLSEELIVLIEKAIELQASSGLVSLGPLSQISVRKMPPDWIYISLLELVQQHEMISLKGIPLLTLDYYMQAQMFNSGRILLQNIENFEDYGKCPMVLPSIGETDLSNALQIMLKVLEKVQDMNTKQTIASTRIQLYKCGLLDNLLHLRNKQWANQIDELINKQHNKTFLFTFSVDHFIGNYNLLDLLRERGYQIEQVIKTPKDDQPIQNQINKTKINENKYEQNLIEENIKNQNETLNNNLNEIKINETLENSKINNETKLNDIFKLNEYKIKNNSTNKLMKTTTTFVVNKNYPHLSNYTNSSKNTTFYHFFTWNNIKTNKTFFVVIASVTANILLLIILVLCSKFYTWKRRSDKYRVKEKRSSIRTKECFETEENEDSEKFIILGKNDVKYIVNGNINSCQDQKSLN